MESIDTEMYEMNTLNTKTNYDQVPSQHDQFKGTNRYAVCVCLFTALGGAFWGYDIGLTGGTLGMESFLEDFCVGLDGSTIDDCTQDTNKLPSKWLLFTSVYNAVVYIGCMLGAFIGGYIADKCGRRVTIFIASLLIAIGILIVLSTPARWYAWILVGRFFQGMGIGKASFAVPLFGAEMAPNELRGVLSGFMQMVTVTFIVLANLVTILMKDRPNGWRLGGVSALVTPLILAAGVFFVPESPRWLYKAKGKEPAELSLKRLRQSENVELELNGISDQVEREGTGDIEWSYLWKNKSIRKRVGIVMTLQILTQATGINPVFTYGGQIFKDVIGSGTLALLILTLVNFLSTIPSMWWVDKYGRRILILLGAVGMVIGHAISTMTFTLGCSEEDGATKCSDVSGYIIVSTTSLFVFSFAVSWGPIPWIYPAEIFPLNVRAKAVSLSALTNWGMGAVMIGIPTLFPLLHVNGVFLLFTCTCILAVLFAYGSCPETKGIPLEEMESLFQVKNGVHVISGDLANGNNMRPISFVAQSQYAHISTPKIGNGVMTGVTTA